MEIIYCRDPTAFTQKTTTKASNILMQNDSLTGAPHPVYSQSHVGLIYYSPSHCPNVQCV